MKRTLFAVLTVLLALPSFAASKEKSNAQAEVQAKKVVGEERVSPPKTRKQADPDGPPVQKHPGPVEVGPPTEHHLTKASGKKFDLRSLPFVPPKKRERPEREGPVPNPQILQLPSGTAAPYATLLPGAIQPHAAAPAPILNFDGLDFANWGAGHPPDTNGDAGPNYYIQTLNTSIGVFRKTDGARVAAFTFDTFMSQGNFGNLCDTDNFGDPVVLYDTFEDRWIITDFAFQLDASSNVINPPGSFQCFAVSMTGDPVTGGWNYYSINTTGGLGDYPKLGIWPDGLYMSVNMFDYAASGSFQNSRLYAFNKAQMYAGSPTVKVVSFNLPSDQFTVLPANARLQTGTPPTGSPNYFASVWNFLNSIQIWKYHVDWNNIPLSTVTGPFSSTMAFWWEQFDRTGGGITTAPTTANANDTLYPRLMVQNQYSNIGGVESLWNTHTVGAGNPTSSLTSTQSAVRYYQLNVTGGTVAANTTQSFTYSPDTTVYRYMPSAAVDRSGDMAIGYSTSNATTSPGLKYAGRLAGDAANSITLTEQTLFQGTGSQSGNCGGTCERWGDYSAMSLDPDGCTFWYTNEYYGTTGLNYLTRVGSFKFASCTPVGTGGTVSGTVTAAVGGAPISDATVSLGARTTTTSSTGTYSFTGIPAGTYPTISASYAGYTTSTSTAVAVTDGGTTTRNFSLSLASTGSCLVDTSQADFNSASSQTNVDVTSSPGDVKLAKPDVLDQSNSNVNPLGLSISTTTWAGQTFTPAISGQLTRADIELFCNACTAVGPNITVSIRATTGATPVPTGADLATATIAGFNDGAAGGLKTATFASPMTVTAGTRYAVILRNASTFSSGTYFYTCSCNGSGYTSFNPYSSGQRVTSTNSGSTWSADTTAGGRDLNFRIYVNAGYSTTGDVISGLKDGNPSLNNRPTWTTLSWTATTPASTGVKFQMAGSSSANGPFTFVGPDGTAATYFTTSGASIAQFNGSRYLEYRAYLTTSNTANTPTLSDVTACFSDQSCASAPPTITPTPSIVCPNATGRTASGPAGMANYSWGITNGTIAGSTTSQSVTYTAGASGTVDLTLTTTDGTGCVKVNTLSVPIDAVATPTITPSGSTSFCGSGTLTSSAASGNQWYLNSAPISGATNATYLATAGGSYTVRVTSVNGCTSAMSAATVVTINSTPPTPTIGATANGTGTTDQACPEQPLTLTATSAGATSFQWYNNTDPIPGATSSTYQATGAATYYVVAFNGSCASTQSAGYVVQNPTPHSPTITAAGPTTFCAGGSVTLQSDSATGIQWYKDGVAIPGAGSQNYVATASGTYTAQLNALGCHSTFGNNVAVTVNPLPATPTITPGGPTTFCAGGSVTLTSSAPSGNQWKLNGSPIGGATGTTYNATASGTYSVTVTDGNACSATSAGTTVTVNPLPPAPTVTPGGPTTFCAGGSVTLTSSAASGNQWNLNGNPIGGATATTYNATASGTYTVTATDANGCSATSSGTSVTVNPLPPTPTITPGGPTSFCTGGSVTLTSSSATGNQWSLDGNPIPGATSDTYLATLGGNYTVTVTGANGCTATSAPTAVTVTSVPATPAGSNGGPYCAGATISLSTSTVAGATYSWTGPNGFTSALQNPTRANAATADAGTYSVTVTVNGCTSAAGTTNVVVNAAPSTPTASNGGPYCSGATISLSTPTVAGGTYSWTGPNGFTSALQNPTRANATTADAGTYSVTVTVNGCTSAAGTTSVVVNAVPATPTASNGGPYCEGATISLSTPTVAGATYSWTGPNGFTSALQNPTRSNATTADGGTYSVTITVAGCTSAAGTTSVIVNATPSTPTASNGGPYCAGATIALSTPTVAGATYSWTGPNGFTSALQNPTRANATTADAGTYSVTITVNGCTSAAGTTNVVVNAAPSTPTASNGGPYCEGATISLSTPTVAGATYSWSGPNGFTSALQNPARANATTADGGTYSVTVTVNGCTSAAGTTNVVVNATPATPTASNAGPYCAGATISLSTPTVAGATYSWTGPNGFTSALQNPTRSNATTADAGTYSVTVTVAGCTSAAGTTSVIVNATPATPTASNGGPYCEGATIALSTPTVAGATYSWTGPNGFTSSQQNPTRSNATVADAGIYSVTITVNGCTSAAGTTNVVVNAAPATPTASNDGPYCEGATISLSTPTAPGATYSWTGPNGFTSTQQNPTRTNATTADAGTYSVTITVNGCTSAAGTTNVVVGAVPATPTATNGGPYCEGSTISLSTPTVAGATYSWTGPNGFTSSQQNPTKPSATLADAGTYSVTITVNGCTSAAGTTDVIVNPAPATPAASNGGPYCAGATISLSTPTVAGATYSWTGPNGFTSSQQNPTRSNATTADAGTYSVTITVNGCTSAAGTTDVVVNAIPSTPTASNGGPYCEGATISLSTPTVAGATYSWTGPNGFTSSQQNPTRSNATTADAGTYSVTITVNGCTSAAGTTNVVVNAIPSTPTASNGGPYCAGATISLSTPTVAGATYSWTGPNGFTSSLQNPTRANSTTADAGTYSVTITVNGCTSAAGTTNVVVNATPSTPTASNGGPYCAGSTISLSTATVAGATYSWTGPNGFTSSLQNPTRANAATADAGTYSVTVTVNGCTSAAGTTDVVVNAIPSTPTASNGGPYCEGATISLSTATVAGATYFWTGPNGFTSSLQNPTRANATTADAGTYSVTVTVNGCTSAAGTTNVVVNAAPATPTASNGGPYCAGATISLSTATVAGATYSWTGPNGFTSSLQNPTRVNAATADAGTYSVTITVNGCTSAAGTTNVVVNAAPATPTANNGGPYCAGSTISLSTPTVAGATYSWTGPNGFTSSQQNPTRANAATADAGTYSVTVTVNGCTSAAGTTNVVVNAIPSTPTASNGGPYCAGSTISLSTATVAGATYSWTGPNGFTSSQQNPTRANSTTADAGTYSVTITVNGCTSAAGTTNVVVNAAPSTPTASNGGPYCAGATISLSTATVAGATYSWTGPNGFTSSLQNPTRANAATADAGTYSVTVTANGCTSAAGTTNVVVNAIPATPAAANNGPYCAGSTISLSTPTVAGATYSWTGPNGFTSSLQNPTRSNATTADAGTYSVTVTTNGCTSAAGTTNVVVNALPATPAASNGGPYCAGSTISLSTATVAGATYSWTGPNGFTSSQQNPTKANATTADAGTYSVTITVNGCTSAAGSTTVAVNAIPNATITVASPIVAGASGTASVADAGSGATYNWSISNGTITSGTGTRSIGFTAGAAGTLTLNVTVTVNGCSDAKSANVTVVPPGSPLQITGVAPATGPLAGGTHVTISGSGFASGATVTFGGVAATSVVVVSGTSITAVTPAHAAGAVNVVVTVGSNSATLTNGFTYAQQFDPNGDGVIDPADIFYLVNYLFLGGPAPSGGAGMLSGDANGDGTVDPADIFYLVNYLFLSGPAPMALPAQPRSALAPVAATVSLGNAVVRNGRTFVPVVVTAAPGSAAPRAMSLRVRTAEGRAELVGVKRVGAAAAVEPHFEISRRSAGAISYLVSVGADVLSGTVAEVEVTGVEGSVELELDPALTMLTDERGMRKASKANGLLQLRGTSIGHDRALPKPSHSEN